jgi:hypothetical protein
MGRKIFISYKYADNDVENITDVTSMWGTCTVRDYVDKVEAELKDETDHIYKGESDGEDLSQLSETTIWDKLKNRIYDSTLTVVMLSKGMREKYKKEKEQWIPQEISYSLKEISRKDEDGNPVTSKTNALLAVILPDLNGNYNYFTYPKTCCTSGCTVYKRDSNLIFSIMSGNMFNQKQPDSNFCDSNETVYHGESNYMLCVKWSDFSANMEQYIDRAYKIQDRQDDYSIQKDI